jgi:hypothetical protein
MKPSALNRSPTAIIGAAVTMLTAVVFAAPDLGVAFPPSVLKIITLVIMVAGLAGIHSKVTPVAAPRLNAVTPLVPAHDPHTAPNVQPRVAAQSKVDAAADAAKRKLDH